MIIFPFLISLGLSTSLMTSNIEFNDDIVEIQNQNETSVISDNTFEIIELQGAINEYYDSATNISPENYYLYDDYIVNVEGVLDYCGYPDRDFYYFKLLTDSYVEIECCSINGSVGFEFAIIGYDYNVENDKALHTTIDVYDGYEPSCSKSFYGELKAGTYFIYLSTPENVSNDIEYSFIFYAEKVSKYSSADINYLISTDAYGAVWVSDFVPGNSVSILNATGDVIYYDNLQQGLQKPDYLFDDLKNLPYIISGSSPDDVSDEDSKQPIEKGWIKFSEYYIWDQVMVHAVHEVFVEMYDIFRNQYTQDYYISAELSLQKDNLTGTISIVGTILGNAMPSITLSLATEVVQEISLEVLDAYITAITPSITLERTEYLLYLEKVADATDFGLTDEEKENPDLIRSKERKIIYMPLYYKVNDNNTYSLGSIVSVNKKFESLFYKNNTIYTSSNEDCYSRGKLYSINNYVDLFSGDLELIPEHVHDYTTIEIYDQNKHKAICDCGDFVLSSHVNIDHRCRDCNCYLSEHDYKEPYTWVNTTYHTATCSCGATETQGHAVVEGGIFCLLCHGRASFGFVEILSSSNRCIYLTDNGSCIYDNGMVILVEEDVNSYLNGTLVFYLRKEELEIK